MGTGHTLQKSGRIGAIGRALLMLAGGASFLLFLAVVVLWVRSYFIAEGIYFQPVAAPEEFASPMPYKPARWHYQWHLAACRGKVQLERRNLAIGEETQPGTIHLPADQAVLPSLRPHPLDVDWRFAGLEYFRRDRKYVNQPPVKFWHWGFLIVTAPYWWLALMSGILPAVVGVRISRNLRRRTRIAAGKCVECGYDVRASEGVCPECGAKIETLVSGFRL